MNQINFLFQIKNDSSDRYFEDGTKLNIPFEIPAPLIIKIYMCYRRILENWQKYLASFVLARSKSFLILICIHSLISQKRGSDSHFDMLVCLNINWIKSYDIILVRRFFFSCLKMHHFMASLPKLVLTPKIFFFMPENASFQGCFTEMSFDISEGNQLSYVQSGQFFKILW